MHSGGCGARLVRADASRSWLRRAHGACLTAIRMQDARSKAETCVGARSTVGGEVLIGVEPSAAFPAMYDPGTPVATDVLMELADFRFEEHGALITRSQLEGADILLPKRFVRVCSHAFRLYQRTGHLLAPGPARARHIDTSTHVLTCTSSLRIRWVALKR